MFVLNNRSFHRSECLQSLSKEICWFFCMFLTSFVLLQIFYYQAVAQKWSVLCFRYSCGDVTANNAALIGMRTAASGRETAPSSFATQRKFGHTPHPHAWLGTSTRLDRTCHQGGQTLLLQVSPVLTFNSERAPKNFNQ